MRNLVLGAVGGAVLFAGAWTFSNTTSTLYAQRQSPVYGERGELTALYSDVDDRHGQLTLVDPKSRVVSVYHIDRQTGEIALKSVRNVHWDRQMEEYNGVRPSPREIRSLLQQR